jgi:hypothetical protein
MFAEQKATPNPKCAYEMAPINWDALAKNEPGPDEPGEWKQPAIVPVAPLPYLLPVPEPLIGQGGQPSSSIAVRPEQQTKLERVNDAFAGSYGTAVTYWNAVAPEIRNYTNAARDADKLGLTGLAGADFDKPLDAGADLDKFGDAQTVGLDGQKQAMTSLFKDGGTQAVADTGAVPKSSGAGSMDESLHAALVTAEENIVKAATNYQSEVITHRGLQTALDTATRNAKIVDDTAAAKEVDARKIQLKFEQDQFALRADYMTKQSSTIIDAIGGAMKGDYLALAKAGVNTFGTIARSISDNNYGHMIFNADQQALTLARKILKLQGLNAKDAISIAAGAVEAHQKKLDNAKLDVKQREDDRKKAYDALAAKASGAAAAAGAGPEKVAAIDASVKAIPVVETVLAKIQAITAGLGVPSYTADSGIGFRAAGQPNDFVLGVKHLKGYVTKFAALETKWKGRLSSLQKVVASIYSKA